MTFPIFNILRKSGRYISDPYDTARHVYNENSNNLINNFGNPYRLKSAPGFVSKDWVTACAPSWAFCGSYPNTNAPITGHRCWITFNGFGIFKPSTPITPPYTVAIVFRFQDPNVRSFGGDRNNTNQAGVYVHDMNATTWSPAKIGTARFSTQGAPINNWHSACTSVEYGSTSAERRIKWGFAYTNLYGEYGYNARSAIPYLSELGTGQTAAYLWNNPVAEVIIWNTATEPKKCLGYANYLQKKYNTIIL